jgi:preprotein translocase subunit SecG
MYLFVVTLHVILSLMLILIIILQPGKGGDVGAAFGGGGGGSSMFGPRGPASLLAQMTTAVAVMFMVTSITLAWYSNRDLLSNANVDDELLRLEEQRLLGDDAAGDGAENIELAPPAADADVPTGDDGLAPVNPAEESIAVPPEAPAE